VAKIYTCDVCKATLKKISPADRYTRVKFNERTVRIETCKLHAHFVSQKCGDDIQKAFQLVEQLKKEAL
jgi:Fe2+ or Zn2+ uptake regulation protein